MGTVCVSVWHMRYDMHSLELVCLGVLHAHLWGDATVRHAMAQWLPPDRLTRFSLDREAEFSLQYVSSRTRRAQLRLQYTKRNVNNWHQTRWPLKRLCSIFVVAATTLYLPISHTVYIICYHVFPSWKLNAGVAYIRACSSYKASPHSIGAGMKMHIAQYT